MPTRQQLHVKKHASSGLEWVHLSRNTRRETEYLGRQFGFHPVDLEEVMPPTQRPKIVSRGNYVFMILLFPIYDRKTRIVSTSEVDFFITRDRIVTVNADGLPALTELSLEYQARKEQKQDAAHILHEILSSLLDSLFPMLLHLSQDIDNLESNLFDTNQRELIMDLLRIKTNIVNVRKAMQSHKKVIRRLMIDASGLIPLARMEEYYNQLVDHTKEIWDTLELQRETIDALHEAHSSLLANRTNHIMKRLTAVSAIIFILTLTAGVFTMDVGGAPLRQDPLGFLKVFGLMAALAGGLLLWLKRKNWI